MHGSVDGRPQPSAGGYAILRDLRVRAGRLEAVEGFEPVVEAARREERLGERFVRRHMARLARKHQLECLDRHVRTALLAKDDPDVEVGCEQLGVQR